MLYVQYWVIGKNLCLNSIFSIVLSKVLICINIHNLFITKQQFVLYYFYKFNVFIQFNVQCNKQFNVQVSKLINII